MVVLLLHFYLCPCLHQANVVQNLLTLANFDIAVKHEILAMSACKLEADAPTKFVDGIFVDRLGKKIN